mgnify:CR=1 FL=1
MKIAQEVRAGNVIMIGSDPMVVQKAEFNEVRPQRVGRQDEAASNLLSGGGTETVYRADEKFDVIQLERKEVTYLVFRRSDVRVHGQRIQPASTSRRKTWKRRFHYLEDGLACELTFYEGRADFGRAADHRSCAKSRTPSRRSRATRRARCMKPAKLASGFEVPVPLFVTTGDKIEIDTRTGEYRRRVARRRARSARPLEHVARLLRGRGVSRSHARGRSPGPSPA